MSFQFLKASNISESLQETSRQYLVGDLERPQYLNNIFDEDVEVGISSYNTAVHEDAHSHKHAKEYQYVLKGMTEYLDLDTKEIYRFSVGDFYVIRPGTRYVQKVKKDTRILFFKVPGGNDKVAENPGDAIYDWAAKPLRVERVDTVDKDVIANSMVPATAAAIVRGSKEILLIKRRDSKNWAMPGGTMELDESLMACVKREVKEEVGLDIEVNDIIGTYSDPSTKIAYSDGEVRREFSIVFYATANEGNIKIDDESTDWKWVPLSEVSGLKMANSQRSRIRDVVDYISSGARCIR